MYQTDSIKTAKEKYDSYNADEWIKTGFNEQNGGYAVYHKDHKFDPTLGIFGISRGNYEMIVASILVNYGMSVVLDSEKSLKDEDKRKDGFLNGIPFEIKGIEGMGKNNIINDLKDANKKGAEIIVLYYHDKNLFSEKLLQDSYRFYLRNSKSKRIQHVYFIVDRKLHSLK